MKNLTKISLLSIVLLILTATPLVVLGQEGVRYTPLAPIPGVTEGTTLTSLIQRIVPIAISIGAILAVLMLVIGGFQWMMSEAVGQKQAGRERVGNAIIGLLILLASVLILNTINPQLTNIGLALPGVNTPPPNKSPSSNPDSSRPERIDVSEKPQDYVPPAGYKCEIQDWTPQQRSYCYRPDTREARAIEERDEQGSRIAASTRPIETLLCEGDSAVQCDRCIKDRTQCAGVVLTTRYNPTMERCQQITQKFETEIPSKRLTRCTEIKP